MDTTSLPNLDEEKTNHVQSYSLKSLILRGVGGVALIGALLYFTAKQDEAEQSGIQIQWQEDSLAYQKNNSTEVWHALSMLHEAIFYVGHTGYLVTYKDPIYADTLQKVVGFKREAQKYPHMLSYEKTHITHELVNKLTDDRCSRYEAQGKTILAQIVKTTKERYNGTSPYTKSKKL